MMLTTLLRFKQGNTSYAQQGEGEPLVLLHGVGMKAEAWIPQIQYFSDNYRVIAPDMPGHGNSNHLPQGSTINDYIQWAIQFIEDLNIGPINLAGHSMGSLIAQGVAAQKPELIKRVAVLNGVYQRSNDARQAVVARANELGTGNIDIETPINRWFDQSQQHQIIAQEIKSWLSRMDILGYKAAYTAFATGDEILANTWEKVHCPALILTGELDPNSTPLMAENMATKALNGKAVIIKNERHMVNLTAPEIVNQKLTEWLNTAI